MKRNLFTLAAALSLLMLASTAALWLRSYYTSDWAKWMPDEGTSPESRAFTVRTIRGGLQIEDYRVSWVGDKRPRRFFPGWYHSAGEPPSSEVRWTRGESKAWDDELLLAYPYGWPDLGSPSLIPKPEWHHDRSVDARYTNVWDGVVVPYWIPVALTFLLPAWSVVRMIRRRRRVVRGLCLRCGYDLRATPVRCPECGAPTGALPAPT